MMDDVVVAPASGVVIEVERNRAVAKMSIFMRLWDNHWNVSPMDGTVVGVLECPGPHLPALFKKSRWNERTVTVIDTEVGWVRVVQIGGMIARSVVNKLEKGDVLKRGETIGRVKFGSRVAVLFHPDVVDFVLRPGDKVSLGRDVIGIMRLEDSR